MLDDHLKCGLKNLDGMDKSEKENNKEATSFPAFLGA
jgi:hypothetical protein